MAQMSKVGRNDPCPCGSGLKFKKCHGNPKNLNDAQSSNSRNSYQSNHGDGKRIISDGSSTKRAIAVGKELWVVPPEEAKLFPDFIIRYAVNCLDEKWFASEKSKTYDQQHPLVQWHTDFEISAEENPPDAQGARAATGAMFCWLRFAYDLYQIQHNEELQQLLISRLQNKDQFQGARFELLVTASAITAGFTIEFENEQDPDNKHPEFIAVDRKTGTRISFEAKSRHRVGVLGHVASSPQPSKVTSPLFGIRRLIRKSKDKAKEKPYVVFVDLNIPDQFKRHEENTYPKELDIIVNELVEEHVATEFPIQSVFFVSDCSHYHMRNSISGMSLWAYRRPIAGRSEPPREKLIMDRILWAILKRTNIPKNFPS